MGIARLTPEQYREHVTSSEGRAIQRRHGYRLVEVAPDVYASFRVAKNKRTGVTTTIIDLVESGDPGKGKVGRWLDSLADRRVIVKGVLSATLAGMLSRRGFYCVDSFEGTWERRP